MEVLSSQKSRLPFRVVVLASKVSVFPYTVSSLNLVAGKEVPGWWDRLNSCMDVRVA